MVKLAVTSLLPRDSSRKKRYLAATHSHISYTHHLFDPRYFPHSHMEHSHLRITSPDLWSLDSFAGDKVKILDCMQKELEALFNDVHLPRKCALRRTSWSGTYRQVLYLFIFYQNGQYSTGIGLSTMCKLVQSRRGIIRTLASFGGLLVNPVLNCGPMCSLHTLLSIDEASL